MLVLTLTQSALCLQSLAGLPALGFPSLGSFTSQGITGHMVRSAAWCQQRRGQQQCIHKKGWVHSSAAGPVILQTLATFLTLYSSMASCANSMSLSFSLQNTSRQAECDAPAAVAPVLIHHQCAGPQGHPVHCSHAGSPCGLGVRESLPLDIVLHEVLQPRLLTRPVSKHSVHLLSDHSNASGPWGLGSKSRTEAVADLRMDSASTSCCVHGRMVPQMCQSCGGQQNQGSRAC